MPIFDIVHISVIAFCFGWLLGQGGAESLPIAEIEMLCEKQEVALSAGVRYMSGYSVPDVVSHGTTKKRVRDN